MKVDDLDRARHNLARKLNISTSAIDVLDMTPSRVILQVNNLLYPYQYQGNDLLDNEGNKVAGVA